MARPILLLLLAVSARAQTPADTLKVDTTLPTGIRAYVVADDRWAKGDPRNRIDKMHDLVTDNGLNPVIAVFTSTQPAAGTPMEKLLLELHDLTDEFKAYRLGAYVLVRDLDKEFPAEDNKDQAAVKKADTLKAFQKHLLDKLKTHTPFYASPLYLDRLKKDRPENPPLGVPLGLIEKNNAATEALGLGKFEGTAIVLYDRMMVKKVWVFTAEKPMKDPEDFKEIYDTVKSLLQPAPK